MENVELVPAVELKKPKVRTNWATNVVYSTHVLHEPSSTEEIQTLLQAEEKLTPAGTGHTFNFIADSLHARLSLRLLHRVLHLDASAMTVTVAAGIRYDQLCPFLYRHGLALHNLASLTELSVAGAVSTGAHGSGDANGCLAAAVAGLEIATASGELVRLTRPGGMVNELGSNLPELMCGSENFPGVVVGLGALGVVTELTLAVQPAFTVRQYVYEDLSLAELTENFDAIMSAGYTVSVFTDWQHRKLYQLWIKVRDDPDASPAPFQPAPPERFFGAKLQTRNVNLIRGMPAIHCTEQMGSPGPWHERLPHFRPGFLPGVGDELQSEYFVPRRHAAAAIVAVERLGDEISPTLLESEIRTVAADDLWLSMCYGRDSVALHFCWRNDWGAVWRLLPMIEDALAPFDPRPHWGKLFAMAPALVRAKYEKMEAFRAVAARLDPSAKFRNAFLNTYVFSPSVH